MKSIGFILSYLATAQARRNARILGWMLAVLALFVAIYSALFHEIMDYEGQSYSWVTAIYWTLVTMSTLGYGDIAFTTDLGRAFSVVVLLSGSVFILVLLPFTFIQFVFLPWIESTQRARAPRQLSDDVGDHVILTSTGPIESALIERLERAGTTNTNIAFTVREISSEIRIVATANSEASVDILELAGADQVLCLGEMLGGALARRVLTPDGRSQVIGSFEELLIAEALTPPTLAGHTLADAGIRQQTGLTVGGVWDRGTLHVARPTTALGRSTILILAGSRAQLDTYDERFATVRPLDGQVIVIGGGRVGRAVGRHLRDNGIDHRIVEQQADRVRDPDRYVVGDAADLAVLEEAGIREAPAVVITTHDDDVNVYLTNYCRRLRPDTQIIARARLDRNVTTLHRAGADSVLSYASTGANALWNMLTAENTLQLAEGLDVFRVPVPTEIAGKPLATAGIREATGCTVVAIASDESFQANPPADRPLPADADLVLIGDSASEHRFLTRFPTDPR